MIVPMRKVTLLHLVNDRDRTVEALGRLGVIHLEQVTAPGGTSIERTRRQIADIVRALRELPAGSDLPPRDETPPEVVGAIWTYIRQYRSRRDQLDALAAERKRIAPFGSFDPGQVRALAARGIHVGLYACALRHRTPAPEGAVVRVLGEDRSSRYVTVVSRRPVEVDATPVALPAQSAADLDEAMARIREEQAEEKRHILQYAGNRPAVEELRDEYTTRLEMLQAKTAMHRRGPVAYLRGYCPEEAVELLRGEAPQHGWAVVASDPLPGEPIPTLTRNPRWVRPIQLVFDFIKLVPGYREVDISALFLVFLSLFFAMIVGDAGYGAVFLLLTVAGRKLLTRAPRVLWSLLLLMSITTIVWGLLTGCVFGMERLPWGMGALQIAWLSQAENVMLLCFLIGAIHLSLAHGWNAVRLWPSPRSWAQAGWVAITWGMFFAARTMVLGHPFPPALVWVLAAGLVVVVFCMTPPKRLRAEWVQHLILPLDVVGSFVDVISYIRLFAVGMATFAMASAFNQMAGEMGQAGGLAAAGGALLLFFGHTLNILLATMGVLVHGIRLNTLEFSGHLGMGWTGVAYRPFRIAPVGRLPRGDVKHPETPLVEHSDKEDAGAAAVTAA